MTLRSSVQLGFELVVGFVLVALVVGALLGQPVLLSYVETGSMEPTMNPGDGFVSVPSAVAGDVQEGDVVVFQAEHLHGGGLTTHRVVGETADGYVTKGDANPFTDQDGQEPPVTEDQIVAKALQVGGTVVTIPHLGTGIELVQGLVMGVQRWVATALGLGPGLGSQGVGTLLFVGGVVLFAITLGYDAISGPSRVYDRSRNRPGVLDGRLVALSLVCLVLVPATLAMVVPSGDHEMVVRHDQLPDDVDPGDPVTWEYNLTNHGMVPVIVTFDARGDGVAMDADRQVLGPGETASVGMSVDAPPPDGRTVEHIAEHRYLLVLPPGVVDAIHDVHPVAPWLVIDGLLAGLVVTLQWLLIGIGTIRMRSRGEQSLWVRLRRRFG